MPVELTEELIANNVVNLLGYSGSGKDEVRKVAQAKLVRPDAVMVLSTGNSFRAARARSAEVAETMAKGLFIPDLNLITPEMTVLMYEFLERLGDGDDVRLALDGAWRASEFEHEGRIIINQSEQLAIAMGRAMSELVSKQSKSALSVGLLATIRNEEWNLGELSLGVRLLRNNILMQANHVLVDVEPGDAEALMRFRGEKDLRALVEQIDGGETGLEKVRKLLSEMVLIQQGRVTEEDERIIVDEDLPGFTLQLVNGVQGELMDRATSQRIEDIISLAYGSEEKRGSFGSALERIFKGAGLTMATVPRGDDMLFETRGKRVAEFELKTVEGVLKGELGYGFGSLGVMEPQEAVQDIGPRLVIPNGPATRGITYPEFVASARQVTETVMSRSK